MKGQATDPALKAAIVEALTEGMSVDAAAQQWGIPVTTIKPWRAALGRQGILPRHYRKPPSIPHRDAILAALRQDESIAAVSARFGVREVSVRYLRSVLVAEGILPPLRQRAAPEVPTGPRPDAPGQRTVPCRACGTPFVFRYTGAWKPEQMEGVLGLCMPCFDAYCAGLPLTEPPASPVAPEPGDEEDADAD